jgi:hypothetical protein
MGASTLEASDCPGIRTDSYRMPFGVIRRERTGQREREISKGEIKVQQYIVNLTNDLIRRKHYDIMPPELIMTNANRERFRERVKDDLEQEDVRKMNPETLGRILCSLHIGDVMAKKQELIGNLHFAGDCEDLLRELVATALAFVIRDRLDPTMPEMSDIPPYRH